jgi:hypothetical protein
MDRREDCHEDLQRNQEENLLEDKHKRKVIKAKQ